MSISSPPLLTNSIEFSNKASMGRGSMRSKKELMRDEWSGREVPLAKEEKEVRSAPHIGNHPAHHRDRRRRDHSPAAVPARDPRARRVLQRPPRRPGLTRGSVSPRGSGLSGRRQRDRGSAPVPRNGF